MRRVLLDENVDRKLKRSFDPAFAVTTVPERGWSGKKNGMLLTAAAGEFDVLVTLDRNMQHRQNLPSYDLAVVLLLTRSSQARAIEPSMSQVNRAVLEANAGVLTTVPINPSGARRPPEAD